MLVVVVMIVLVVVGASTRPSSEGTIIHYHGLLNFHEPWAIIYFHIVHVGTAEALSSIVLALISRDRDGNRRKPEDRVLRVTTGVECDRVGLVQSRVQSDRIPWKWHGELLISKQRSCGMTRFYNAYISATFQIFLHCVPAICRREITSETIFLLSYVWNINNRFSLALWID